MMPTVALAHFPFLTLGEENDAVTLSAEFSEAPGTGDAKFLSYLEGATVSALAWSEDAEKVELDEDGKAEVEGGGLYALRKDLGVITMHGATFFLSYTAYAGPGLDGWAWRGLANDGQDLEGAGADRFVVVPEIEDGTLTLAATFDGEAAEGVAFTLFDESGGSFEVEAEGGSATYELNADPVIGFTAKYVEEASGEADGKAYEEVRHYLTATFGPATHRPVPVAKTFGEMPELVTSLGAAVAGDKLFVYGGHTGGPHSYYAEAQADTLRSLDLTTGEWAEHGDGDGIQGHAMVAHDGIVYRLGGVEAMNADGETWDLQSRTDAAAFDPATGVWAELPALPERRSSFDAAVLDGSIYIAGGWNLNGETEDAWHATAWRLDLDDVSAGWKPLPDAPFLRRAVSAAAHDGKLYVLGGMQDVGAPTTATAVFDPATDTWSEGPNLVGGVMVGFGSSAFAAGGRLYASVYDGTLQRLSEDGSSWEVVGDLPEDRFFHRMVAWGDDKLVIVGGASMRSGKFEPVHVIDVTGL